MLTRTYWDMNAHPINTTENRIMYALRADDGDNALMLDSVCAKDFYEDADAVLEMDALITPYQQLERKMNIMMRVMERIGGEGVKPVAMQITSPFKKNGVVQVAVIFELSDGQTATILFHNPDSTPSKLAPTDELISWKWMLNKKDVTIVVAPEQGKDLKIQEVCRRILRLADKNSAAFARANAKRAERLKAIEDAKAENEQLQAQLDSLNKQIEILEMQVDEAKAQNAEIAKKYAQWQADKVKQEAEKAKAEAERQRKEAEEAAKKAQEEAEASKATETTETKNEDEEFLRAVLAGSVNMDDDVNMERLEKVTEQHDVDGDPLRELLTDALNAVALRITSAGANLIAA